MITMRWIMICSMVALTGISSAFGADANVPQKIIFSGTAVDDANTPVAGAKVTLYLLMPDVGGQELKDVTTQEQITKDDGGFSFSVETQANKQYRFAMLAARKDGRAIGWDNWDMQKDKTAALIMSKPYKLNGVVVDDANKPIADTEVRIAMLLIGDPRGGPDKCRYLTSAEPLDLLKVTTDANGAFMFNDIPMEAKAEFMVKKAGRATISTISPNPSGDNFGQYTIQSRDIKIIQPIEARIEGKVVEVGTAKPVGGITLVCMVERYGGPFGIKPVVSKDDGTFVFDGLEAKTYTVQEVPVHKKTVKWVIKPAKVTTAAGQTSSDVIIEASQGGLLEVTIKDTDKKPVAGANINVRSKDGNRWQNGTSDANGIASIRLAPGDYELQGAYKDGYSSSSRKPQSVTIEDGKTTRLEMELKGAPKISGIVTDMDGKPVADTQIKIFPNGGVNDIKSDASGKFEIAWNPQRWGGNEEPRFVLLVRHVGRNLAAAVDVNEDTKTLDVKMSRGIIFTGKVVDPNSKPLPGAQVQVNLRISNWSTSIDQQGIKTDAKGMYEYKALPGEQNYSVSAQADGYGQSYAEAHTDEAVDGRLTLEPQTLKLATMSVSGTVVDENDKPIANADVQISGQGQQYRRSTADAQGKFTIDKLCEGQVHVNANVNNGSSYLYAYANVEAGETDIKLILSPQGSGRRSSAAKEPPSLKGKPLPNINSLGIKLDPNDTKDKAILLCFIDLNQRPSRHCVNELAKKYTELTQKGVVVAVVQVGETNLDLKYAFTLCQIANDEKTRFAWGIKSLPWLIVTDKQHTIKAEGFTLAELDEKLKTSETK